MSTTPPARHYVFDAGHALLGAFADADEAHRFAHDTSRSPHTRLPLEVADPAERTSFFVHADRCESVRWLAVDRQAACTLPAAPAGRLTATIGAPAGRGTR